jgi:hypothetical protein
MYVQSPLQNNRAKPNRRPKQQSSNNKSSFFGGIGNGTKNASHGKRVNPNTHRYTPADSAAQTADKSISPYKIIFFAIIAGAFGILYLSHVFATQKEYKAVLELRREYEKIQRLHADRQFTYDRMTGPAEVYSRAKTLGLKDGGPADGIITVKNRDR